MSRSREPDFTLSAGPTPASPKTLAALGSPIVYHYDPQFLEAFRRTERQVAEIFKTRNTVLLMQGEAGLGLEAAARSLVAPGTKVLNLVSGVFGRGMGIWLRELGAELQELESAYDDVVEPEAVERHLASHPDVALLTVVHCETPSGTCTDLASIATIARRHGVSTLVDCVSSVGGMEFDVDGWGLDVCVLGPQKCLGGPPGLSLMSVSERAWETIEKNPEAPRSSFLSMLDWKERWLGEGHFPVAPSVADVHGVEAACEQLLEEGLEHSIARHAAAARGCRDGVRAMGLRLWPRSEEIAANTVTAIAVPDGLDPEQVRAHARERYGVMLSAGQGAGNVVQIGHMGPTANGLFPVVGLMALGRTLLDLGARLDLGAGVAAALESVSQRPVLS